MNETDFIPHLIAEIMQQGYDRNTAADLAVQIGDTPAFDDQGNIVVLDGGGHEIVRLKPLRIFAAE